MQLINVDRRYFWLLNCELCGRALWELLNTAQFLIKLIKTPLYQEKLSDSSALDKLDVIKTFIDISSFEKDYT